MKPWAMDLVESTCGHAIGNHNFYYLFITVVGYVNTPKYFFRSVVPEKSVIVLQNYHWCPHSHCHVRVDNADTVTHSQRPHQHGVRVVVRVVKRVHRVRQVNNYTDTVRKNCFRFFKKQGGEKRDPVSLKGHFTLCLVYLVVVVWTVVMDHPYWLLLGYGNPFQLY